MISRSFNASHEVQRNEGGMRGGEGTGNVSTAVGTESLASGAASTALGNSAVASAENAMALGANAFAGFANSTAIGEDVVTTRENQMALGNAATTYTAAGITSDASRAVQTGDLELITTDASGNLASDGGSTFAAISTNSAAITTNSAAISTNSASISTNRASISSNTSRIGANEGNIAQLNSQFQNLGFRMDGLAQIVSVNTEEIQENKAGIAIANAMAGASWLQANETHAVTGNWGYYADTNAFAFTATQRLDKNWSVNGGIGFSPDEGEVGARAGFRLGW
ncbi:MAG: YadA-like family protein [Henriciella sp.]